MDLFAAITYGRWHIGVGDPTVLGWVATVGYFVGAALCAVCAFGRHSAAANDAHRRQERVVWRILTVAVLLLGVNKQLDLQTLFTQTGRDVAHEQGWFEHRRNVQLVFVVVLASVVGALMAWLGWAMRGVWRQQWLAGVGLTLLAAFALSRAGLFHHADEALGAPMTASWVKWLPELAGIACIVAAAAMRLRR
jgi:hypothetical protein